MKKTFLLTTALLVLLGAGCTDRFRKPEAVTSGAVKQAFEQATSTFGEAATSTSAATSTAAVPVRWERTEISSRNVSFAPPSGYWVFSSEERGQYYLVPGKPPAQDSPDPSADVLKRQVAEFYPVERNAESFPTWERFELTMAQFACASGDTDETFTSCTDKTIGLVRGKTAAGLPYVKFTLPSYRKQGRAFMGNHTYFMVRLGNASDHAVFVSVLNEKTGVAPAWTLVRNMRIE